jgi:hypothetical protein
VPNVNDLNYIVVDAIENFETVFLDDLPCTPGMLVFSAPRGCRLMNSTAAKIAAMTLAAPVGVRSLRY